MTNFRIVLLPIESTMYFEVFLPFVNSMQREDRSIEISMADGTEKLFIEVLSEKHISNVRYMGSHLYNYSISIRHNRYSNSMGSRI